MLDSVEGNQLLCLKEHDKWYQSRSDPSEWLEDSRVEPRNACDICCSETLSRVHRTLKVTVYEAKHICSVWFATLVNSTIPSFYYYILLHIKSPFFSHKSHFLLHTLHLQTVKSQYTKINICTNPNASIVTKEILHQVFDVYGNVESIAILQVPENFQALVTYKHEYNADSARRFLHGRYIYDGGNVLDVKYFLEGLHDEVSKMKARLDKVCSEMSGVVEDSGVSKLTSDMKEVAADSAVDEMPVEELVVCEAKPTEAAEVCEEMPVKEVKVCEEKTMEDRACIPLALTGRNICGSAFTGSGKTAVFALPTLERLLDLGGTIKERYDVNICPSNVQYAIVNKPWKSESLSKDASTLFDLGGVSGIPKEIMKTSAGYHHSAATLLMISKGVRGLDAHPSVQTALVGMYGKCGSLADARCCFDKIRPNDRNLVAWNTMITAYASHGLSSEAVSTFEDMIRAGKLVEAGMWEEVKYLRALLKLQCVKKNPGCSWIEVNGEAHLFLGSDTSHIQTMEIYKFLEELPEEATWKNYKFIEATFPDFDPWGQGSSKGGGNVMPAIIQGKIEKRNEDMSEEQGKIKVMITAPQAEEFLKIEGKNATAKEGNKCEARNVFESGSDYELSKTCLNFELKSQDLILAVQFVA